MLHADKKPQPLPLEDLVVRYICKNINSLTYTVNDDESTNEVRRRWRFPHPDFRIPATPAQKILLQLCKRTCVDDERISLFSSEFVSLISPVIKDASVSASSLRILKDFTLANLAAVNLQHVTLNSLIGCLGESTVSSLVSLNVTGTSILCETNLPILVSLGRFKALEYLNVTRTEFTSQCLQTVVNDLPNLTCINISRTNVADISPLLGIRDRLLGLIMHRLELQRSDDVEKILSNVIKLHKLHVLDVSDKALSTAPRLTDVHQLVSGTSLPNLMHIDLSGNPFGLRLEDVRLLLANHPKLKFVGLASWLANPENELIGIHNLSLKYPHITIMGDRGDQPLLNTLSRNKDRAFYLQNALHCIFEHTSSQELLKPDLLQAVLRIMRLHLRRSEMVLAGTAVIYNMTRGQLGARLSNDLLNRAIRMTMTAMETFPDQPQLQKNCFLTLCSDTVLYRASFNCSHCCELVFNALLKYDDNHMKRMGVAIISILAAEITTTGLSNITRDRRRLRRLLLFVVEKGLLSSDLADMARNAPSYLDNVELPTSGAPVFDTTLRFTLSALWNLTDECPDSCQSFVDEGGLDIYVRVVRRFGDQEEDIRNHVYTKCLGLLNNVAEVVHTRHSLLQDNLMDFFYKMLRHQSIHISYFAAGVVAHLSCLGDAVWTSSISASKESFIRLLGECVCGWHAPDAEMVTYRSFEPFEKLIRHPQSRLEVHLWAVWAIHHILTKKVDRYVPVLIRCKHLFEFICNLTSVEENILCANSLATSIRCLSSSGDVGNNQSDGQAVVFPPPSDLRTASDTIYTLLPVNRKPASSTPAAEGASPCVGPDAGQLACAHLIKSLAVDIISAVGQSSVVQQQRLQQAAPGSSQ